MRPVILILLGLLAAGRAGADITIAVVTSASVGQGLQLRLGVDQAIEAINRAGGVLGEMLRSVSFDDACDPDQAVIAAQRVLTERNVSLIVGHDCSAASIRAAPVYASAGVIHISPVTTNPRFTEMGIPTLFRAAGRDDRQAAAAARLITERWPNLRLAVLDDGRAYGKGLADMVRQELATRGKVPALSESYRPIQPNYAETVGHLREKGIELLYLTGYTEDMGLIVHQIRAADLKVQVVAGDSGGNRLMPLTAGAACDGMIFTSWPDPAQQPRARQLIADAAAKGLLLDGDAALAYAAVEIWAQAAAVAGVPGGQAVAEDIHRGRFETIIGTASFDAKGDVIGPLGEWNWYRWQGGHFFPLSKP